jgi:formate hydrogenlyase subunit 4
MTDIAIHLLVLILLPPFLLGVINKTKAFFAGRKGPPLLQTYRDIAKLLRKGMVISGTTTWIFRAGPLVTLAAVAMAGLLVPFGASPALIAFQGDLVLFAYLFGLARFFTTSAALDTGSSFEGMGSAREATFAVLTEPALFFAFLALARMSGSLSLGNMLRVPAMGLAAGTTAPLVLIAIGLFIILLAETCRIPVDDPNTHLELTMIHEAMVLDHSGPLLGAITYSASLKLLIIGSVLVDIVAPWKTGNPLMDWPIFAGELMVLAVVIGVVESIMARLRMNRVPYLLVSAILLCGSAFILLVR